jgi:hypothetical protein
LEIFIGFSSQELIKTIGAYPAHHSARLPNTPRCRRSAAMAFQSSLHGIQNSVYYRKTADLLTSQRSFPIGYIGLYGLYIAMANTIS